MALSGSVPRLSLELGSAAPPRTQERLLIEKHQNTLFFSRGAQMLPLVCLASYTFLLSKSTHRWDKTYNIQTCGQLLSVLAGSGCHFFWDAPPLSAPPNTSDTLSKGIWASQIHAEEIPTHLPSVHKPAVIGPNLVHLVTFFFLS